MLTGLLVFLLVLIALLAVPVTLSFRLSWPDVKENNVRLRWGFVQVRLPTESSDVADTEKDPGPTKSERPARPSAAKTNVWAAFRLPRFRRRLFRFLRELWAAIHKQDVRLKMRIGLDNPADTGRLWAAVGPVSGMLASLRTVAIRFEPEFQAETVELAGQGRIRIVPLQLLYLAGALCFSPSIWRGLQAMRTSPG